MGINNVLRQLPHATLKKRWRLSHALAETRTLDDYSQILFHHHQKLYPSHGQNLAPIISTSSRPIMNAFRYSNFNPTDQNKTDMEKRYWGLSPLGKTF